MIEILSKFLKEAGIKFRVVEHEPVYTVAESVAHMPDAFPVKNLLLMEEKGERLVLVIMKGDERLDVKQIALELGTKKLRFAKPEVLMAKLGVLPGSASLFSLLHSGSVDVEVAVDSRLVNREEVGFHPSNNTQTILIAGKDIETFMKAIRREFRVLDL